MKNVTAERYLLLVTCAAAVSISSGCRTVPGMNMFAWRSKPSAEALAGTGPSATYPAPPSDSVTPAAIASIAGGTAGSTTAPETTQVAGIDVSPGYATPAASLAAAQANGIYPGSNAGGFDPTTPPPGAGPSGYQFGSKAFTPKTPSMSPDASTYSLASASGPASGGLTVPSTSSFAPPSTPDMTPPANSFTAPANTFAPPPMSNYTTPPTAPSTGGFDLPSDPPSLSANAAPGMTFPASLTPPAETSETTTPPSAAAPSFSTASAAPSISAPSSDEPGVTPTMTPSYTGGSYSPGSTGNASAYPIGDVKPTTNGSIFR